MGELIRLLTAATGLGEFDIRGIVRNAPYRYKLYHIPKRSGGRRQICHPARELKILQRVLLAEILDHLPVHDAATAYRLGVSIKDNAEAHAKNGAILKYDFKDFFPSIRDTDWRSYCERNSVFKNEEDVEISCRILFWSKPGSNVLRLSIGAPSSPALSNILMRDFDERIQSELKPDKVTYTRYADDLTFSGPRVGHLSKVEKTLRRAIKEMKSPRLRINEDKTVLATKKYRRTVTGLILSNDGDVSIGRERKKAIRAAVHHASKGKLSEDERAQLGGLLAFVQNVEPSFLIRLTARYGEDVIKYIKKRHYPEVPFDVRSSNTSSLDEDVPF
jgi:RNA-directed DNA polymerase